MNKALLQKALAIAALACIILIALWMISGIIDDRQHYRDQAVAAIDNSYAGPQVLVGPVLVRPYTQTVVDPAVPGSRTPNVRRQELSATSFPRALAVKGPMRPDTRRHGLYKVETYEFEGKLNAHFDLVNPPTEGTVVWGEPYLALSVSDPRGILGTPTVVVNGSPQAMLQGAPKTSGWQPNLHIPLRGFSSLNGGVDVSMDLDLAGTETLSVAPVADANTLDLRSTWASPLFAGNFLPRTRDLSSAGFHAVWDVSSIASRTQIQLEDDPAKPIDEMTVHLTTLMDPYSLSNRAVKYGILFVLLTFGGFFLYEQIQQLPLHPVQYLLVGLGLAIFFLLLISFSEHMPFGLAYLLASLACIGLLVAYLSSVLHSAQRGLGVAGMLTSLYAAIYGLLLSEDNALLLGSLLLFFLLAGVMFLTRNIDWYRTSATPPDDHIPTAPPPLPL